MQGVLPVPGDVVWIRQRRWRVERAIRDRGVLRLDVASRDERLTFLAPFDRPAAVTRTERPRRARPQRALARLAHVVAQSHSWRTLVSAIDADVAILPHQLEPALAILGGARRVLLADDVGLGKTIQAGLVIAEILRRHVAPRVLVIVPASLRDQWTDELGRRFRVICRTADRSGIDEAVRSGARLDNPWDRTGVWISSLDYLKQRHVLDTLPFQPWDLVVVDEAHDACGDSARHAACDELVRHARHALLLTATPHTGDEARFRRLTDLGVLDAIADPLTILRRSRTTLALAPRPHVRWHFVNFKDAEARLLQALKAFEQAVLAAAGTGKRDPALLLLSVFRKRALSTMSALARSLNRRLEWLEAPERAYRFEWLQPSFGFESDASDDIGADEAGAIVADVGFDGRRERAWIRRLLALAEIARRRESKIERLAALVSRSREPLVVFTEFRDSLHYVKQRVESLRSVAILHGGQTAGERRLELARFLGGAASVLLATDVAGQGLNLQQRARWVVSLELPWNPGRLEQRAGRVDRIGQTRQVHVTLLVARHEAEAGVLARLAHRTLVARRTFGADVLATGAPDGAALSAAVLTGAPLDVAPAAAPSITLDRTWVRIARTAARRLVQHRALAERWRAPAADASRPFWTYIERYPEFGSLVHPALLVFSVPLVDRSGALVEQHVVPVRLRSSVVDRETVEAARRVAARVLSKRAVLVSRGVRARFVAAAACERAIRETLASIRCPDEVQPGLFDRRDVRAFDAARRAAADLRVGANPSGDVADGLPAIRVGSPTLELVFTRRP